MADHNIEINVNLHGSEQTKQELQNVKSTVDALNNGEINIKIATTQFSQQMQALKREIDSLGKDQKSLTSILGINAKDVDKELENAKKSLRQYQKDYEKAFTDNKGSSLARMARAAVGEREMQNRINLLQQLKEVNTQLETAKALRAEIGNIKIESNNADKLDKQIDELEKKKEKLAEETRLKINAEDAEAARQKVEELVAVLQSAASALSMVGSGFSALGDFSGMFASAFEGMSNVFNVDALGTAKRYLTAMATRAVTGQISGIIERYDIMNTFTDYMQLAGVSESVANESLNAVDLSIRGIPIGLDEAAFRLRKYQMYMGDIKKATDFTIGIQKAITAGGASEQMKTTAYTQIDRLLATGKLGQSRQWLSLFNGLGVSLKFLREELALDPTADLKTIAADLSNGTIATEDFIDAIARLSSNEGLDQAIEIYKGTIAAWQANISNAIKRGGQNILENVNDVMTDVYDTGITGVMKTVRDEIDTLSADAGEYIRQNPQHAKTIGDAVTDLFDRVMSIDGGRIADKLVENLSDLANTAVKIFDAMPDGFLEDFASFATTWAGPMATLMKAAQSGLPVLLGIFDRMRDFDMGNLMEKIVGQIERMARAISTLLNVIPDGMLGDLISFGIVWGKPLGSVFGTASKAISEIAGALNSIQRGGGLGDVSGSVGQLALLGAKAPALFGVAGGIAAIAGAIFTVNSAIRERDRRGREIFGLDEIDRTIDRYNGLEETFDTQIGTYKESISAIREAKDESQDLLDRIFELDEAIRKAPGDRELAALLSEQKQNLAELKTLQPDMTLGLDAAGRLENADAVREEAKAYTELYEAQSELATQESAIEYATDARTQARVQKQILQEQRNELQRQIRDAENMLDRLKDPERNAIGYDNFGNPIPVYSLDTLNQEWEIQAGIKQAKEQVEEIDAEIEHQTMLEGAADETVTKLERGSVGLRGKIAEFADTNFEHVVEQATEVNDELQRMKTAFEETRDEAQKMVEDALKGFGEIDHVGPGEGEDRNAWATTTIGEMLTGQTSQNTEAAAYKEALEYIDAFVSGLDDGQREIYAPFINGLYEGGFEDRGGTIAFSELIKNAITGGATPEEVEQLVRETYEESGLGKAISNTWADIMMSLNEGTAWDKQSEENPDFFGLTGAITDLKEQIVGLGDIEVAPIESSMSELSSAAQPVAEAAGNVASNADDATEKIVTLADTATQKAGSMSGLQSSLSGVATAAAAAAIQTRALASAISSLQDKTVTITVNRVGSLPSRGGWWGGLFKGGPVAYLADGGHPGFARGSDTIPAWLTPGEFVIRRSAVGMFGSRLMDRLNHMDIGGAFDALMQRVANPLNYMHGNTYHDNHAAVNNYFYGDNAQNYSQRKAYRYARSL